MSQSKIEPLLREAFLLAIPAAANLTKFENQTFDPKGKAKWYGFTYLPNAPEVATLGSGGQDRFSGLVQIDINIKEGAGKTAVESDVDLLRAVFKAGARLVNPPAVNVVIKSCGRSGPGFVVDGFYRYPVTVEWETRISRGTPPIGLIHAIDSEEEEVVSW